MGRSTLQLPRNFRSGCNPHLASGLLSKPVHRCSADAFASPLYADLEALVWAAPLGTDLPVCRSHTLTLVPKPVRARGARFRILLGAGEHRVHGTWHLADEPVSVFAD